VLRPMLNGSRLALASCPLPLTKAFVHRTLVASLAGILLALLPATASAEPNVEASSRRDDGNISINGYLVIVGGGGLPDAVRDRFLELARGKKGKGRLVVIPTASELIDKYPQRYSRSYEYWRRQQGLDSVSLMHTRKKTEANDPKFIEPLKDATAAWLGGGDQSLLIDAYGGTAVERELRKLLDRGGVIGGTSAGASVMSRIMITGGNPEARVGTGFGLLPDVVIDQHFDTRKRQERLEKLLKKYPNYFGLGIDEATAVVLHGRKFQVLGNSKVYVSPPPLSPGERLMKMLRSGDEGELLLPNRTVASPQKSSTRGKPVAAK
jgi:cyanophycinase